ncbi:MAG: BapA prefix-like domain-containing protein, partial [Alcaligenaceae bacterium]|nr:BapA prefix-like domain-containing protein [Alcaligenaceae bacterium]
MTIDAIVSKVSENAESGIVHKVDGQLSLNEASKVYLDLYPKDIAFCVRDGNDLVITLVGDGEERTLRIKGFFKFQEKSELYLNDDSGTDCDALVLVVLEAIDGTDYLEAEYIEQSEDSPFDIYDCGAVVDNTAVGSVPLLLLGGLLAGGLAAGSGGSSGSNTLSDGTFPSYNPNDYAIGTEGTGSSGNTETDNGVPITVLSTPVVTITEDANNDVVISADELSGLIDVRVDLPAGSEVGDTLRISDGITSIDIILTENDITEGYVTTQFAVPPEGGIITVTAILINAAGDASLPGSDTARIDTTTTGSGTQDTTADNDGDGTAVAITSISDDTGTAGDFTTNDQQLRINGTVDLGDATTLTVTANGSTYTVGDTFLSVDGLGNWTLDLTGTTLASGTYLVTATVTDAAGNIINATQNVIIDAAAPSAPTILRVVDNVGSVQGDVPITDTTDDTQPTLHGTAPADAVSINLYEKTLGLVATGIPVNPDGTWTFTPSSPLPDGSYSFNATAVDAVGNESGYSPDWPIGIDTLAGTTGAAPVVTITEDANNDGVISSSELSGNVDVRVSVPAGSIAGDTLRISDGTTTTNRVLTADDLTAGS